MGRPSIYWGASSPLKLIANNKEMELVTYVSVVIKSRDSGFLTYALTQMDVVIHNEFTFILHGDVHSWQKLFLGGGLEEEGILDLIFDLISKGNNIFKLSKEGNTWRLK